MQIPVQGLRCLFQYSLDTVKATGEVPGQTARMRWLIFAFTDLVNLLHVLPDTISLEQANYVVQKKTGDSDKTNNLLLLFLTLSNLSKIFSRQHIEIFFFFSYFPRKQELPFHANCLQWRQFA